MFKLPKSVDYSVLILVALFDADEGVSMSAPALASACSLPPQHVAKILKQLQRQGVVNSVRGPKGGYSLQSSAREMSLLDVYQTIEGPLFVSECLKEETCECRALPQCILKPHIAKLNEQIYRAMAGITLAQLSNKAPVMTFHV